ncbi:hypothetical protein EK0264_03590 [Epidermidibacterium keratini]|uniref:PD-(D/E)XK endonuclease-like domain-containing protein n=1 Tax=Epidermidibacterium keratini TaxID=1891644 RepID=A0A7L4YKQ0_9ACTN|nr:hypothetical protein [Epidermidibacterium keratini]QHB99452.1 hypothetical protein EK0264_03590 [Epidermidibacterium keratini]
MSIKRINAGRGHYYKIDGKKADGVTTILNNGVPKPALINWAANTTAGYAVDHWTELEELTPSQRLDKLKKARWNELDKAGKRGTEVHDLAERLAHGEEVDVPDEIAGHIESAARFLDEWKPKTILTETVVGHRTELICGTFDYLMELPDGKRWLVDWKTTRSGIFGETALQLAAYKNMTHYLDSEGTEKPVSELEIFGCMAVWIRADGYDVYRVQDPDECWKVFRHITYVSRKLDGFKDRHVSEALEVGMAS